MPAQFFTVDGGGTLSDLMNEIELEILALQAVCSSLDHPDHQTLHSGVTTALYRACDRLETYHTIAWDTLLASMPAALGLQIIVRKPDQQGGERYVQSV